MGQASRCARTSGGYCPASGWVKHFLWDQGVHAIAVEGGCLVIKVAHAATVMVAAPDRGWADVLCSVWGPVVPPTPSSLPFTLVASWHRAYNSCIFIQPVFRAISVCRCIRQHRMVLYGRRTVLTLHVVLPYQASVGHVDDNLGALGPCRQSTGEVVGILGVFCGHLHFSCTIGFSAILPLQGKLEWASLGYHADVYLWARVCLHAYIVYIVASAICGLLHKMACILLHWKCVAMETKRGSRVQRPGRAF